MTAPKEDEQDTYPPEPKRWWTYSKNKWDPSWYNKIGWPYLGGDEWGRQTIVIGFSVIGYLVLVFRTCWCSECHDARQETYGYRMESQERDHARAKASGELQSGSDSVSSM